ncbi:MAG: GerW family sporulation protein [Oscillospiraceae bacterium]|nr:GerW family sporulation protein [Oscillospiraceae bacterium]
MDKHPIQSLMSTTMENIKDMVDVNTVVGDPVMTNDGTTIIPISRVSFGFLAGGGEYGNSTAGYDNAPATNVRSSGSDELPFAGGTGAGVSVHPMGFLVVGQGQIKMLPTNYATPVDRVMELLPQVLGEIKDVLREDGAAQSATTTVTARTIPAGAGRSSASFGGVGGGAPDPVETAVAHPTITEHVHAAVKNNSKDNSYEGKHGSIDDKKFSSYADNKSAYHDTKSTIPDRK